MAYLFQLILLDIEISRWHSNSLDNVAGTGAMYSSISQIQQKRLMVLGILVLLISLVLRRVKLTILQDCGVKPMSTPNLNFSFNSKLHHKNPSDVLSQDILSIKSVPISKDTDFFLICSRDIEKQNQVLCLII